MHQTTPPLVMGTEVYSGNWGIHYSTEDIEKILSVALQNGVTEIDTAASYGENHYVERLIGDAISGVRGQVVLASKFHYNHLGKNRGLPISTVSDIQRELSLSLQSLKTDYLDIYYFHSGSDEVYFQDHIWTWLNDMVRQGVIRRLGLSLSHSLVKTDSNKQLLAAKEYGISAIQTVVNLYSQEALRFVIPYCKNKDLTVYGRMPLAKGLLSGKYARGSVFPPEDPRARDHDTTSSILEFVERNNHNINVEGAIRWSLQHVEKIVIGIKTVPQLEEVIRCTK